jgi:hypothetical protein
MNLRRVAGSGSWPLLAGMPHPFRVLDVVILLLPKP